MIFLEIIVHEDLKIVGHGDLETMVTKTWRQVGRKDLTI
jgi:hypothetical protein